MRIPEKSWTDYIDRLARINEKAGDLMRLYIEKHGTEDIEALIQYASALVTKYGEGSAELACQMYDAAAEASGVTLPPAEPAQTASREEVVRMVNGNRNSQPNLQSGVSRLVKQAAADTTLKNAARDGAEWAWIPHGDTCPFCIMLAGRGWQRASKKALEGSHAPHIHANCDCEYAVRFDRRTTVAGYDPERYLAQYNAAGGDINKMRRAQYAENRDKINAQKRAAYAARRLREQAAHGILDDITGGYLPVTEQSVKAVQPFTCRALDEAGQQALAQAHRELLQEAANHPVGTEVARCYGLDMRPLGETIIGGQQGRVRIPDQDVPYIAAHTHPSGLTFSPGDIRIFARRSNMRMLTAIGNDGHVYAVEKTDGFVQAGILDRIASTEKELLQVKTAQEAENIMRDFLKETEQYGVRYHA